jgi:hypothetical protein
MMRILLAIMFIAMIGYGCDSSDFKPAQQPGPGPVTQTIKIDGKAAQPYLCAGWVVADKITNTVTGQSSLTYDGTMPIAANDGSSGNEAVAKIAADGSYSLNVADKEDYGVFNLLVVDGKTCVNGVEESVSPMVAPMPTNIVTDANGNSVVDSAPITPVTTMVALQPSVAKQNELKAAIGADWDADIADPAGTSPAVLKLAKSIEAVLNVLTQTKGVDNEPLVSGETDQLAALTKVAETMSSISTDIADDEAIATATKAAVAAVLEDEDIVSADQLGTTAAQIEAVTNGISSSAADIADEVMTQINTGTVDGKVVESTELVNAIATTTTTTTTNTSTSVTQVTETGEGGFASISVAKVSAQQTNGTMIYELTPTIKRVTADAVGTPGVDDVKKIVVTLKQTGMAEGDSYTGSLWINVADKNTPRKATLRISKLNLKYDGGMFMIAKTEASELTIKGVDSTGNLVEAINKKQALETYVTFPTNNTVSINLVALDQAANIPNHPLEIYSTKGDHTVSVSMSLVNPFASFSGGVLVQ